MHNIDLVIDAHWVVPVRPAGVTLEHHSVVVDAGRIEALVPTAEVEARYAPAARVALPHHALMPGLVNAHTHAAMNIFKGLADDLPLMTWLENHVWPAEARWMSAGFVRDGTRLAMAEMLLSGTTCFNDMYFYPDEAGRAASEAGMRAVVGLIVIDFPTVWANGPEEYVGKGLEVHDTFRDHPLVRTAFAPHAPYTVSDAPLERIRTLADELDIPVHMHVHETAGEVESAADGRRPLARLDALGLLSDRLIAVHMTQLHDAEIERVAEAGVHVAHCVESNQKLASGACPVARLVAAGANVAIGTDGAASNNDLGMLSELRSASLYAKAVAGDASVLDAHRSLEMATLGGARALGLDALCGSLEPGKAADVVAVDLAHPATQPVYDPVSQIIYAAGDQQVSDVWIAGRQVVSGRSLETLDLDEVLANAREWATRVAGGGDAR